MYATGSFNEGVESGSTNSFRTPMLVLSNALSKAGKNVDDDSSAMMANRSSAGPRTARFRDHQPQLEQDAVTVRLLLLVAFSVERPTVRAASSSMVRIE